MSLICIGDLHLRENEVYAKAQQKFLNWVQKEFNNEIILFLGDIFDCTAPMWWIYSSFKEFLKNRKNETYILTGNHDFSKRKGNVLNGLHLMDNVKVFFKEEEFEIENNKCLALPYQYNMNHYENIEFTGDYCFCHHTPKEESFGGEYVKIPKVKVDKKIYGHIHLKRKYENGNLIIQGTHYPTRNLEKTNPILKIENKEIIEIDPPEFLRIETINYGDEIKNKDWLYNIKNCPDVKSVYEKYKECYIRREGIELFRTENDIKEFDFRTNTIKSKFVKFAQDNSLDKEVVDCCLKYLEEI